MQVQEVMSRSISVIDAKMTIRDAAQHMRTKNVGAFPVGEDGQGIGMVTDRDIAMRAVAEAAAAGNTTVRDVMSKRAVCCFADDELHEAASTMAAHQVRRLPVINRRKELVGMLALADLARHDPEAGRIALHGISEATAQPSR